MLDGGIKTGGEVDRKSRNAVWGLNTVVRVQPRGDIRVHEMEGQDTCRQNRLPAARGSLRTLDRWLLVRDCIKAADPYTLAGGWCLAGRVC